MEIVYIEGNLLMKVTKKIIFGDIMMYASEPPIIHRKITAGAEGVYIITDDSFVDSVFLSIFVSGGVTFYEAGPYILGISPFPKLKSELDIINNKVLLKLEESQEVHKLVLMGYFAQFELYLMEMVILFILSDEKHIDIFINSLKQGKIKGIYRMDNFLQKMLSVVDTPNLSDKVIEITQIVPEMFIYHQFENVRVFFKSIYGTQIPSILAIKKFYSKYRHDLIHRNGKSIYVSRSLIDEVYKEMIEYATQFNVIKDKVLFLH